MTERGPRPHLTTLRARIARIEGAERRSSVTLPFGLDAIDRRLPGGGLALGALHEVAGGAQGATEAAAAAFFAAGIPPRVTGKVLWCITQSDLIAPALALAGLDPARVHPDQPHNAHSPHRRFEEETTHCSLAGVIVVHLTL